MNEKKTEKDDRKDKIVLLPEFEPKKGLSACLVGKLWIDKTFNVRAFITII